MNRLIYTLFICLTVTSMFAQTARGIMQEVKAAKTNAPLAEVNNLFTLVQQPAQRDASAKMPTEATYFKCQADALHIMRTEGFEYLELAIPTADGRTFTLELVPSWPFSADFQIEAASGSTQDYDLGTHFRGVVRGDNRSVAAISIYENEVMGLIATDGQHYNLGKLEGDTEGTHILYKEANLPVERTFNCLTDDVLHAKETETGAVERTAIVNTVDVYVETDQSVFTNKGSVANVVSYMGGLMNQIGLLYKNDSITLAMSYLYVWDVFDPYTGPSAPEYMEQFRLAKNGTFNGDIAHLVSFSPDLGGIAYVNVPCFKSYGVGYSSIDPTFQNIPTYSWAVNCIAHELGHNLGSKHTHACAWNGNNTAIDGCGPAYGADEGCVGPIPASGTIMSYCHLIPGVGVNFANGFGAQPGALLRSTITASACMVPGGGGGTTTPATCTQTAIANNTFETSWGIWSDGGADCVRFLGAASATAGSYSIRLRDNTVTSVTTSTNQNLSAYSEVQVSFGYLASFFEANEDFWLQISTNGGTTWTTKADLNCGVEFVNGQKKTVTVKISGPFTTTTRFRFRADASDDDDVVYIDNVVINGCKPAGAPIIAKNEAEEMLVAKEITLAPNPATASVQIIANAPTTLTQTLSLTGTDGVRVHTQQISSKTGAFEATLDLTGVRPGLYIVQLAGADGVKAAKLLVF